jgi:tripeptide aminopeptidase
VTRAPFASPLAEELAPDVLERFLRYVRIDTQARYDSPTYPSRLEQLELSRLLCRELEELGLDDVHLSEHGYVVATLPATVEGAPTIGLIAHVDTSPDAPGAGVQPIVHRAWDGSPIRLPGDPEQVLDPAERPELAARLGHDIVTSDGTTLLGADDKAGIAEIVAALAWLRRHPEVPRCCVRVAFTCDEEIGRGTEHFDVERFGAVAAYTLDGSGLGELETETFSAEAVTVRIRGHAVHPGSAKGRMVNAVRLAADLVAALPRDRLAPEVTEGREGFIHPSRVSATAEEAVVELIVRDYEEDLLAAHVQLVRDVAEELGRREPRARITVESTRTYSNMRPVLEAHPEVVARAEEAIRRAGVEPVRRSTRGGTDGAMLSARGLPTPNLFTGGQEYHSVREWASVQDMAAAAATVIELVQVWAEPTGDG